MKMSPQDRVVKKVLPNGLTVLVYRNTQVPKVSSQLWYRVGSKNELPGERGLAHFLEHLLFKGTKNLSETDLTLIAYKLSGYSNAFTSYDYTGYLFDFPKQHWTTSLELFADCMRNCTFKQEHINSELKAVIQELKLYKDDYVSSLTEELISMILADHPYHHPVIGYKQDLWSITRESLMAFYQKYYIPSNAVLVIVGDVEVDEAIEQAERHFKDIPSGVVPPAPHSYHNEDMSTCSVTLYRDVEQPATMLAFVLPGLKDETNPLAELALWIIASGKGSRLYRKLVEEEKLVSHIEAVIEDFFDYSMLFIGFYPYAQTDNERILALINAELDLLIKDGFTDDEMRRALKQVESNYAALRERNQEFADAIGETFLATGNENYMLDYLSFLSLERKEDLHDFIKKYIRPIQAHKGYILPISESDEELWLDMQEESDALDEEFLSKKIRTEPIEKACAVNNVSVKPSPTFKFPRAKRIELDNGLIVLHHQTEHAKKIDMILDLKAYNAYDPHDLQGLLYFTSKMMAEGTKNYSGSELARELESRGIFFDIKPGLFTMSLLRDDFEKGLELLTQMVTDALMEEKPIEVIRSQMEVGLKNYWDDPSQFIGQLARDIVYVGHPHSYNKMGNFESVFRINQSNILDCYKQLVTPKEARLAIVGDISGYDLNAILKKTIGMWQGPEVRDLIYPILRRPTATVKNYPINRDQITLGFVGLSASRLDPAFDSLLLFDQIFSGGAFGAMTSRLFMLREQSGLFYSIQGSLLEEANMVPGMVFINTLVSRDRLEEAEHAIADVMQNALSSMTYEELAQAKSAVCNGLIDNFASNLQMAVSFIVLDRYNMPDDYFDQRANNIRHISYDDVMERVRPILDMKHIATIRVGRV